MNNKELEDLIKQVATSPAFIDSVFKYKDFTRDPENLDFYEVAAYFFFMGYGSCLDYVQRNKNVRPFVRKENKE